jgi:hypothetical protein
MTPAQAQEAALSRAAEMLRVAAKYARKVDDWAPTHASLVAYDGTHCDGFCLADDCDAAAEDLSSFILQPEEPGQAKQAPAAGGL